MERAANEAMAAAFETAFDTVAGTLAWVAAVAGALWLGGWLLGRLLRGRRRGDVRLDRAREQLRAVEASGFERVPLLNREEARLLPVLERAERAARDGGRGHRVMAQCALGEVIRPLRQAPREALAAINSKRLDFAVFDDRRLIVCAVEYHGTGHWQGHARERDAVKREALRRAGVPMIEVHPGDTPAAVLRALREVLG